jgi:hybrid cluster-associated redox disulfide protein
MTGKITKDMTIGGVIEKYPEVAPILIENGIHCIGCHASAWETLEQGLSGHGMNEKSIEKIIKELNKAISKKGKGK